MHSFTPASADHELRHVFLRDMVLLASIGVHAFEHEARQRIRINLDLAVIDEAEAASRQLTRAPAAKDELHRVVDYEAVAGRVRSLVASGHVRLLETLAERIAEACLEDARVRIVRIRIEKLDIFADMASVGIEIERRSRPLAEAAAN